MSNFQVHLYVPVVPQLPGYPCVWLTAVGVLKNPLRESRAREDISTERRLFYDEGLASSLSRKCDDSFRLPCEVDVRRDTCM